MPKKFLVIILLSFMFIPTLGYGYNYDGKHWFSSEVEYYVNPNCADETAGSSQEQIAAIQAGARTWNNEGNANFQFVYAGQSTQTLPNDGVVSNRDGYNQIMFVQDVDYWYFNEPYSPDAAAATFAWSSESTGEIVECDTAFNDVNFNFSTKTIYDDAFDIWNQVAHHFGYFLKLGNTLASGTTMYGYIDYGETKKRDLAEDDIEGIQYIYGAAVNTNPILSNGSVGPSVGTEETEFGFYVDYYDADADSPSVARVYINDMPYDMSLISGDSYNGRYAYMTYLTPINPQPAAKVYSSMLRPLRQEDINANRTLQRNAYRFYFYFEDAQGGNDILSVVSPDAEEPYIGPVVYHENRRQ